MGKVRMYFTGFNAKFRAIKKKPYFLYIAAVAINAMLMMFFLAKNDNASCTFLFDFPTSGPLGTLYRGSKDTFMDYYNSVFNAFVRGRFGAYNSIYPPLVEFVYAVQAKLIVPQGTISSSTLRNGSNVTTPQFAYVMVAGITLICLFIALSLLFSRGKAKSCMSLKNCCLAFASIVLLPPVYALERGNSMLVCLIALLFFVFFFERKTNSSSLLASLALAIAVNIKLYPALMLGLYIAHGRYREFWRTVVMSLLIFILPLFYFKGLETAREMIVNLRITSADMGTRGYGQKIDISNTIAYLFALFTNRPIMLNAGFARWILLFVSLGAFFAPSVFHGRKPETWCYLGLIGSVIVMFPSFSYVYNGCFLIPALVLFLRDAKSNSTYTWILTVLFIIALLPIPFGPVSVSPSIDLGISQLHSTTCQTSTYPMSLTCLVNSLGYVGIWLAILWRFMAFAKKGDMQVNNSREHFFRAEIQ